MYNAKKQSIWEKRFPTAFGLVLLLAATVLSVFVVRTQTNFFGRAATGNAPENVRITNITDTSFTVTYTTSDPSTGSVVYGQSAEEEIPVLDDRDQAGGVPQKYTTHHITIRTLNPDTEYLFSILSNGTTFTDNGSPFSVTTAGQADTDPPTDATPLTGTVILPDGAPAVGTLIFASGTDTQTLSTLTNTDGTFALPMHTIRFSDFSDYAQLDGEAELTLLVQSETATSEIDLLLGYASPMPQIMLSKNYDFRTQSEPLAEDASGSAEFERFPLDIIDLTGEEAPKEVPAITSPDAGEQFTDRQPQFSGTAAPNAVVEITIQSDPITAKVKADSNGNWSYRPDKPLEAGQHTISVITKDPLGLTKRVTQSFTVFAEGSQFTEPSVSPSQSTPTPTRRPTVAPTKAVTRTPTPTRALTPTTTPTPTAVTTPTSSVMPTRIAALPTAQTGSGGLKPSVTLTPVPSIAPTGNTTLTFAGFMIFGITLAGFFLFFLTKGGKPV